MRTKSTWALTIAALGVVFGDLGTSPLYALRDTFVGTHPLAATPENVLGVLSLFAWSLILVVCLKYIAVIMRADNRGEGGILALLSLTGTTSAGDAAAGSRRWRTVIVGLGMAGAALLVGDGVITPAISVLSAVEGITVSLPRLTPMVVPATVVILLALFLVQSRGSGQLGRLFGPILLLWFLVIGAIGLWQVFRSPSILMALDPRWGARFFIEHGWSGIATLGAVVLCLTGGEALYADMGHFGTQPIRRAWYTFCLPGVMLSYLGQGAQLLADPSSADNPFFRSAPAAIQLPLVALSTVATVIASQALITAVFSLVRQAVQLGLSPRVNVVHTSETEIGQVYLPGLNTALMVACLALVVGFQSSTRLAAAFGLAVSGTMAITTLLFAVIARQRWQWPWWKVAVVAGGFFVVDLAFLSANLLKIADGGWIPLVLGGAVFLVFSTWRRGKELLAGASTTGTDDDLQTVLASIALGAASGRPACVRGTAVFLAGSSVGAPRAFLHNLKHNRVLHAQNIFLTVRVLEIPTTEAAERVTITSLLDAPDVGRVWRVVADHGYMETADVPALMQSLAAQGIGRPAETSYFLGRETIVASAKPGMALWRERLYSVLHRNTLSAAAFFDLPPNRVVELGAQVEI